MAVMRIAPETVKRVTISPSEKDETVFMLQEKTEELRDKLNQELTSDCDVAVQKPGFCALVIVYPSWKEEKIKEALIRNASELGMKIGV